MTNHDETTGHGLPGGQQAIQLGGRLGVRRRSALFTLVTLILLVPVLWLTMTRNYNNLRAIEDIHNTHLSQMSFVELELKLKDIEASLWRLQAKPTRDMQRLVRSHLNSFSRELLGQVRLASSVAVTGRTELGGILSAAERLRRQVDPILNMDALERDSVDVQSALAAMSTIRAEIEKERAILEERDQGGFINSKRIISSTTRDALIMLLLLISVGAVAVFVVPSWVVEPLTGFLTLSRRLEKNRMANIRIVGNDELAEVGKAVKNALNQHAQLELRKTGKLLELRKLIRALVAVSDAPIFVLQDNGKIDYVNQAASTLLQTDAHKLEGAYFNSLPAFESELFAPERLFTKDMHTWVNRNDVYRIEQQSVVNRSGQASRHVLVFHQAEELTTDDGTDV